MIGQTLYGAMVIVKQFPIHRCGHEKKPISANDCLKQLICTNNNPNHYMLATQDPDLTRAVKKRSVCPLIYLKGNTIVMEKPDQSVKEFVRKKEEKSSQLLEKHEIQVLKQLKKKHDLEDSDTEKKTKRRRKGPKGPNPLSCKSKKKRTDLKISSTDQKSANTKKRSRVPKHIKRMFAKIESNV